ncbi:3-dehydroquinate synthase II family protein [Solidesulfovibrio sp.]|uniref:3-dehydroquinate synthase II family protein n=1 Tax=Solidesulfovibrio sp. TaxID=2910990 RepID=UPI002B1F4693|nr:3-dehydroquinate synthase II family protein [Solidesulfovibrio sp.]MEA4855882.1 3-dehydroquinate synthase II family protein [Solidesulfovibrio sp.]
MSKEIWLKAIPFDKKLVTLGLESGVDGFVAEPGDADKILALGRTKVMTPEQFELIPICCKDDEGTAVTALKDCRPVFLAAGWEIIPVENILACTEGLGLECESLDRARLAAGVLERGADRLLITPEAVCDLKTIVNELKLSQGTMELTPATVTAIEHAGLGHRVCVDTTSLLKTGEGMLVGNSSAFTFLVNAETESNPYVAARPFRVNAGAVHAYCQMPGDKTRYLEELAAGSEVLVVGHTGATKTAVVGRVKTEIRPMLLITAEVEGVSGKVFLQNAETIRLVTPEGKPVSVVTLKEGDRVLVRTDVAGRHFGMRITEDIKEG